MARSGAAGEALWKAKDMAQEQQDRDKRAMSRGKIAKGPMFRHKPMGAVKAKIEELVDQLQENNQTILLQKLQLTSLNEEYLTLVNMDNQ